MCVCWCLDSFLASSRGAGRTYKASPDASAEKMNLATRFQLHQSLPRWLPNKPRSLSSSDIFDILRSISEQPRWSKSLFSVCCSAPSHSWKQCQSRVRQSGVQTSSRSRCLASAYTRARVTNRTNATINPTALDQRKWTSCPTGARSAMQNFCAAPTGKPYRIRFRATGAWGVTTISASELLSCSNLAGRHPTAIDGRRARHFKQLKDATLSAKAERIGS